MNTMRVIPALDLREGCVVQLVGGAYDRERVRREDPLRIAQQWALAGFTQLHIVDLDAATGRGSNRAHILSVLRESTIPCHVGGGIRTEDDARDVLDAGASAVVVGTRALAEPAWLEQMAHTFPGRCVLAADVRERQVTTNGWNQILPRDILSVMDEIATLPLAGILVTAVHCEGLMQGTDLRLMEEVVHASRVPIFASGGIGTMADLRALEARGVSAAVLGMALYTGTLDPRAITEEFSP